MPLRVGSTSFSRSASVSTKNNVVASASKKSRCRALMGSSWLGDRDLPSRGKGEENHATKSSHAEATVSGFTDFSRRETHRCWFRQPTRTHS